MLTKGSILSKNHRNRVMLVLPTWILVCLLSPGCHEPASGPTFDPHIEDLKLVRLTTGHDALQAIDKLHGMPIDALRGFIAHYEKANDKTTIWVSEASSGELAKEQIAVMIRKMKENRRSPFSRYRTLNTGNLRIIVFDGLGQVHYVFREDSWVYWISADAHNIDTVLRHVRR